MKDIVAFHTWEAERYHTHSSAQNDAASQLLQFIQLKGHESILDVGCGDGKISAEMARSLPTGAVMGIDISYEMICFANKTFPKTKYPNLTFSSQDAQEFNYHEKLDIIFSSFALQWLPNPSAFFKCAYKSLNASGYIAATIPLGISNELERATSIIVSLPEWSAYFQNFFPNWHFLTVDKYKQLLIEHQFMPTLFSTVHQTAMYTSRKNFEEYVIQWFSYLSPLPQSLKQAFFKQVIDKYLEIHPPLRNGEVSLKFLRLDLLAKKITP